MNTDKNIDLQTIRGRVKAFCDFKGMGVSAFEAKAGLPNATFKPELQSIRLGSKSKISAAFPELNMTWLLTGDGEMLNGETGSEQENSNPKNMTYDKFFQTIERRDRQFEELLSQTSRLIAVIERMQGVRPVGEQIPPPYARKQRIISLLQPKKNKPN